MATPLTEAEITAGLGELDGWRRDGERLVKQFSFDNYLAGLAFASAVGVLCEGANHHPDMTIGWRRDHSGHRVMCVST
ncbi:MAG: 4a-hydroxytetrahydrobiopterin dehydratase, partial [Chloroflexi bacterium]|nr:4a-hydroxytetrahydrobiopterin dehydratase [Chloroflexota bacterium]